MTDGEIFDTIIKLFTAVGAFASAIAGIYLGADAVAKVTTKQSLDYWFWYLTYAVVPLTYVIIAALGNPLARSIPGFLFACMATVPLSIIAELRLKILDERRALPQKEDVFSRRISWPILVIGFDLLWFGAALDLFKFLFFKNLR